MTELGFVVAMALTNCGSIPGQIIRDLSYILGIEASRDLPEVEVQGVSALQNRI
jgi:hypothetical protein